MRIATRKTPSIVTVSTAAATQPPPELRTVGRHARSIAPEASWPPLPDGWIPSPASVPSPAWVGGQTKLGAPGPPCHCPVDLAHRRLPTPPPEEGRDAGSHQRDAGQRLSRRLGQHHQSEG